MSTPPPAASRPVSSSAISQALPATAATRSPRRGRDPRARLPLALSALLFGVGCSSQGGQGPLDEPGPDLAESSRDLAAPATILGSSAGCGSELFADGTKPEDFSSQAAFEAGWQLAWSKPQISAGHLALGPHPLSPDWWENYSPATTRGKPGDVLLCARLRLTTQKNDPAEDNSIELTLRNPDGAMYETAGMVLLVSGNAETVQLRTRTGPDSWVRYAQAGLRMESGVETSYDLLLFGQGSHFVAEVRNNSSAQVVRLRGDSPLAAGGAASLVGWRSRNGIYIDQLILGQPSLPIAERLMTALAVQP